MFDRAITILDGPTGTELQRRGVPTPLPGWSAHALLTHPDIVRAIHDEYIAAGADIITTNTFRTNARAVRNAGLHERARELTRIAVAIAREATTGHADVFIAGSVAPVEDCYRPDLVPSDEALAHEHAELIGWLLEEGVGLLKIETMNTLREARAATIAARRATSLPVLVGLVCGAGARLLSGERFVDAARALVDDGAGAVLVNCSSVDDTTVALRALGGALAVPYGAYANGGAHGVTTEAYADAVDAWRALGATIVGGCCGTRPEHIATLRARVARVEEEVKSDARKNF